PEWQGLGVGSALQARLQEYAVTRGVRGFVLEILPQNQRMQHLAMRATGRVTTVRDDDEVKVTILFSETVTDEPNGQPSKTLIDGPVRARLRRRRRSAA